MPSRPWIRIAEITFLVVLAIALFASWRADRRDREQLASQLAAAQQALNAAGARQHDRDALLTQTLAQLSEEKRKVVTPAQILRDLPNQIPLPAPISLQREPNPSPSGSADAEPKKGAIASKPADAVIPGEDLKPLYDFAIECKACQAKLSAAQSDLSDERIKTATLAKEKDEAVRAARGGGVLRRMARAAKWFAIGAAAGAIAAKATH
jgi:type II secretory pathway pseudopilin PulG